MTHNSPRDTAAGPHFLVVIDHRQARIFKTELHGEIPQRITPYDPQGYGRSLHHTQEHSDEHRKPALKGFYEAVASTLHGAGQILLFGAGTGAGSAMAQLLVDLKQHHHQLAERVVASVTIDEHHLTDDQLLAKARECYAHPAPAAS